MVRRDRLSHEEFEDLVEKALTTLPEEFQEYLENVVVIIEDEPPDDMPGLMGLYEGVPLSERSMDDSILPDCITIYKGPIERACRTGAEMEAEVRVTVLHEIGHFFGLEEGQLELLEAKNAAETRDSDEHKRYYYLSNEIIKYFRRSAFTA